MKKFLSLILCVSFSSVAVPAMETDQYNLSPQPLADIASEVEAYVAGHIQAAIDGLNAEITKRETCLVNRTKGCQKPEEETAKLAALRTDKAVAKAVYERLGSGNIFVTKTGKWLKSHAFTQTPSRYKTSYLDSIYWTMPVDYATLSPTIRVHGVEFGTDKLDHFFQQGYQYYAKLVKERSAGKSYTDAAKKAVSWGRKTENTYFGYMVAGVYSNADLYANYAGMRFYEGLTSDIRIGEKTIASTLKIVDGKWAFNASRSDLLRPYVSDHLNEALNPSNYLFFVYPAVKSAVKKRACPEWRAAFPNATRDDLNRRTESLETWDGEDYGFKRSSRQVRVGDVCFTTESRAD